jgi:hypothetical protein
MPDLQSLFNTVGFALGLPATLLVLAASAVLAAAQDWRLLLAMLMAQTVGLALLAPRVMPPEWAVIHIVTVGLVAIMWFLSARMVVRQARPRRSLWQRLAAMGARLRRGWPGRRPGPREVMLPTRWLTQGLRPSFRALLVILVGLAAYTERARFALPGLPSDLGALCWWVFIMAVLGTSLSDDPFRLGLSLTSGLSAFRLFYLALAPSTLAVGLLDGLTLLAGLACSYLMVAKGLAVWLSQGERW